MIIASCVNASPHVGIPIRALSNVLCIRQLAVRPIARARGFDPVSESSFCLDSLPSLGASKLVGRFFDMNVTKIGL